MKIVMIGSGNIAHFFLPRLQRHGHEVVQVYSPNPENAGKLAALHQVPAFTGNIHEIDRDADAYILAVKDDALPSLNEVLRLPGKLVIHCAGAVPLSVIGLISANRAVIWTLYSVRKSNLPVAGDIPLVVEACTAAGWTQTLEIARSISGNVLEVSFEQRQLMHLNAVLVNNFTNHLFTIAEKLSAENGLPFEALFPIIKQTFSQLGQVSPSRSQTGPAIRKDESTLQKHLALLQQHEDWRRVYEAMSRSIQNTSS